MYSIYNIYTTIHYLNSQGLLYSWMDKVKDSLGCIGLGTRGTDMLSRCGILPKESLLNFATAGTAEVMLPRSVLDR